MGMIETSTHEQSNFFLLRGWGGGGESRIFCFFPLVPMCPIKFLKGFQIPKVFIDVILKMFPIALGFISYGLLKVQFSCI
jgi:hypothetical protein